MKPINQPKMTYQDLLITTTEAENYAQKYFGITAKAKALPGFEDFNFRLKVDNGEMYILKILPCNKNSNTHENTLNATA